MGRIHPLIYLCLLSCAGGFLFSAVSTSDFVAHLDRQVHGIHCSFLPGLAAADQTGATGCHTTLMSPYSSVLRHTVWGGVPVALPGMAVFAFLAFWCLWIAQAGRDRESRATGFLAAGALVPLLTSVVMGYLSVVKLDATCKLCIGVYASSALLSLFSFLLYWSATNEEPLPQKGPAEGAAQKTQADSHEPMSWGALGISFGAGVACVLITVGAYAASVPDYGRYVGSCGSLPSPSAPEGVIISYGESKGAPELLEVLDPLCPSCKGFEERFSAMPVAAEVDRKFLLFPLDESCNWMIDRSIHPGACSISEAVLCSTDPQPVLEWAFAHQKEIMAATEKDPKAAANMAKARFPALSSCIGSAEVGAKLNQSLRWAVKNRLPILTPQVFVEGLRLCGEDTDLGLDFALPRLLERAKSQPRPKETLISEEADAELVPTREKSASSKKEKASAKAAPEAEPKGDEKAPAEEPAEAEPPADDRPPEPAPEAQKPSEEEGETAPPPPAPAEAPAPAAPSEEP